MNLLGLNEKAFNYSEVIGGGADGRKGVKVGISAREVDDLVVIRMVGMWMELLIRLYIMIILRFQLTSFAETCTWNAMISN